MTYDTTTKRFTFNNKAYFTYTQQSSTTSTISGISTSGQTAMINTAKTYGMDTVGFILKPPATNPNSRRIIGFDNYCFESMYASQGEVIELEGNVMDMGYNTYYSGMSDTNKAGELILRNFVGIDLSDMIYLQAIAKQSLNYIGSQANQYESFSALVYNESTNKSLAVNGGWGSWYYGYSRTCPPKLNSQQLNVFFKIDGLQELETIQDEAFKYIFNGPITSLTFEIKNCPKLTSIGVSAFNAMAQWTSGDVSINIENCPKLQYLNQACFASIGSSGTKSTQTHTINLPNETTLVLGDEAFEV